MKNITLLDNNKLASLETVTNPPTVVETRRLVQTCHDEESGKEIILSARIEQQMMPSVAKDAEVAIIEAKTILR